MEHYGASSDLWRATIIFNDFTRARCVCMYVYVNVNTVTVYRVLQKCRYKVTRIELVKGGTKISW